jgi:hypothetical protein
MVVPKCLVNRLRPILVDIVSKEQSVFVPGRLITNNALLAFECLNYFQTQMNQNNYFHAYKLDLSKVHGQVDWEFLQKMMKKLGFAHRWVDWIMMYVSSIHYEVLCKIKWSALGLICTVEWAMAR